MTKAITLHQPWASLIALGVKTIETRSWKPPAALIGQRLLIHAGALKPDLDQWYGAWCTMQRRNGRTIEHFPGGGCPCSRERCGGAHLLPVGAIVASCIVADAVPMVGVGADPPHNHLMVGWSDRGQTTRALRVYDFTPDGERRLWRLRDDVTDQLPYGDFAPGRWAWLLEDITAPPEPIPAKGHQRVWNWEPA